MANTIKLKRGSGSDPGASDLAVGEIAIRTDEGKIFTKKDDGTVAEISGSGGGGTDFEYLALRNAANNGAASYPAADFTLVTDGTTNALTPTAANTLIVSYGGVIQQPNTGTSTPTTGFALSGSTIKFGSNIAAAPDFIIYQKGAGIGTPSNDTVDLAQLAHATQGDVLYYGASGAPARLAADNGKFLRSNGNSSNPSWETVTSTPEGTAILSTGESGGSKYLREDGDGTCSWQSVPASGAALTGSTDNTITTVTGANAIQGESNLTFNGSTLAVTGDISVESNSYIRVRSTGDNTSTAIQLGHDGTASFTGVVSPNTHVDMPDSAKIKLGTGDDLEIYHDGTNNIIKAVNSNSTYIDGQAGWVHLQSNAGIQLGDVGANEVFLKASDNSAVELNFDNALRFKTRSNGNELRGNIQYVEGLLRPWSSTGVDLGTDADRFQDLYLHNDLDIKDAGVIKLGDGDDLQIWHDAGAGSNIRCAGTKLEIRSDSLQLQASNAEKYLLGTANGATELYYDNSKKFETYGSGVKVYNHLRIQGANDENAILNLYADNGDDVADLWQVGGMTGGTFEVNQWNGGAWENTIKATGGGSVELYYNNLKQVETTNDGITVTNSNTNVSGAQVLLKNYNNTVGYLYGSGTSTPDFGLLDSQGHWAVKVIKDGATSLYYDNSKKLETTNTGIKISGSDGGGSEVFGDMYWDNASNAGKDMHWDQSVNKLSLADDVILALGGDSSAGDLQLYHDGSNSYIKNSTNALTIQGAGVYINDVANGKTSAAFDTDGAVTLYYDNSAKLQTTSAGGTLTGTWTGAGKILQVVSATSGTDDSTTDDWNGSANSNAGTGTALGPTVSITPSSTSSKIIVIWSGGVFLTGGSSSNKIGILGLFNDTSDTQLVTARCGAQLSNSGDDWGQSLTMIGYDSPSSTSAQTYTLVAGRYSGTYPNTIYTNYGMPNDGNDKSVLTAMEVA